MPIFPNIQSIARIIEIWVMMLLKGFVPSLLSVDQQLLFNPAYVIKPAS